MKPEFLGMESWDEILSGHETKLPSVLKTTETKPRRLGNKETRQDPDMALWASFQVNYERKAGIRRVPTLGTVLGFP